MLKRVVIAAAAALAATAIGSGRGPRGDGDVAGLYPNGLRIGYAVEAPYAFVDEAGRVTGESPELARLVAHRLGLTTTFVQADFGELLDLLENGQIDVVATGMFITPERARRARFSVPTLRITGAALVRRGNPQSVRTLADIAAAGATVVVVEASVEADMARRAGISREHTLIVPDAAAARRALLTDAADLLLLSEPTVRWMAAREGADAFDVITFPPAADEPDTVAFAFRASDRGLAAAWNGVLTPFVGSPEHLSLIAPFGFTRHTLPERHATEATAP